MFLCCLCCPIFCYFFAQVGCFLSVICSDILHGIPVNHLLMYMFAPHTPRPLPSGLRNRFVSGNMTQWSDQCKGGKLSSKARDLQFGTLLSAFARGQCGQKVDVINCHCNSSGCCSLWPGTGSMGGGEGARWKMAASLMRRGGIE
jgi:hypothetical protein